MENKKIPIAKGFKFTAISIAILITAPILITMGFKGIRLEDRTLGFVLLIIGILLAITGIALMALGIKYILDSLFEK
jgi:small neutral amino acid transporter SnatA (MarC family)